MSAASARMTVSDPGFAQPLAFAVGFSSSDKARFRIPLTRRSGHHPRLAPCEGPRAFEVRSSGWPILT